MATHYWETIISYEDRVAGFDTSRWRLFGVRTKESAENTDAGVLWLSMARKGGIVTADLYKSPALGARDKVATGSADVSCVPGATVALIVLDEANASGLSGSFELHWWINDDECAVQVALCVDEDLDALWDGVESLTGYDPVAGCAEFIRLAGEDVLARVAAMYGEQLGGGESRQGWFMDDAVRLLPDLRRIANPAQLRLACAHRALEIALGRTPRPLGGNIHERFREYHRAQFKQAMSSLVLSVPKEKD